MRFSYLTLITALLATTSCVSHRISDSARESHIVTVKAFKPHLMFDGNQTQIWVAFDFEIVGPANGPRKFKAVSDRRNWVEDFEFDGHTLKQPIATDSCPMLQIGGRYRIETIPEPRLASDFHGARHFVGSCERLDP